MNYDFLLVDGDPCLQKTAVKTETLWPRFSNNINYLDCLRLENSNCSHNEQVESPIN